METGRLSSSDLNMGHLCGTQHSCVPQDELYGMCAGTLAPLHDEGEVVLDRDGDILELEECHCTLPTQTRASSKICYLL